MNNMRQRPRVDINHIITYTYNLTDEKRSGAWQGLLINLSTSGALIETKEPVTEKSLIIGNNSDTMPRMVIGEVVYNDTVISAEGSSFGMYRTGIKFTDTHENAKEFVVSIVKPEEAATKIDSAVVSASSSYQLPHFDSDSIHNILDDEATTASHINIDDLLLDDEEHDPEFDVLENIATLLEENEVTSAAPKPDMEIETIHETTLTPLPVEIHDIPQPARPLLNYINAIGFFLICLVLIPTFLFLTITSGTIDDWKPELPFLSTQPPVINASPISEPVMKARLVTLIQSSIKGRFVHDRIKGSEYIISGFISATPDTTPDEITITGRLYTTENQLVKKIRTSPEEKTFFINSNGFRKQVKTYHQVYPFHLAFSGPTANISRYSIDIE